MMKPRSTQLIKLIIATAIGSVLFAVGLDGFLIPHKLMSGGLSGIAVMVYFVTGFLPGTVNLVLNIPVLYAAYRWLGGMSVIATILGTLGTSFAIDFFKFLQFYNLTDDPLIGAIVGGVLVGIGSGIIYRADGNTGGIDPIAQIIRKYKGLQLGNVIFAINFAIVGVSAFIFNIQIAAITLMSIYITTTIVNKIIVGFNHKKAIFVISNHAEAISQEVIKSTGRGGTLLQARGAYTKNSKEVLLIVATLMQITKLKDIILDYDPTSFILITDASEVVGLGFTTKMPPQVEAAIDNATATSQENNNKQINN